MTYNDNDFLPENEQPEQALPEAWSDETETANEESNGAVVEVSEPSPNGSDFEDLTLAEVVGEFFRAPMATIRAVAEVAQRPAPRRYTDDYDTSASFEPRPYQPSPYRNRRLLEPETALQDEESFAPAELVADEPTISRAREAVQLVIRFVALALALIGSSILASMPTNLNRTEANALNVGAPYLLLAVIVWLGGELYISYPALQSWWRERGNVKAPPAPKDTPQRSFPVWTGIHPVRVLLVVTGVLFSIVAWSANVNNLFTTLGFWAWAASIITWILALAPSNWRYAKPFQALRTGLRENWRTILAVMVITLFGAYFRLSNIEGVPPEMTSDHVEKLLDSQRVLDGTHQIFFSNNGGREAAQMYLMALFSQIPGLGMNFDTLKLLSALEGIITIPVLWWMGREVIGPKERRLGNIVGLVLAALVAASYWHTALSRLALRIVLTPLVTSLLLIYLSRAMRYNRRGDFLTAGLVLGFGLYTYQAVRILPIVVVIGIGLALLFRARNHQARLNYLLNFGTLVLIAFVVFVPLGRFSVQYSDDFWRRTSGRLLGDDIITETDEAGNIVERFPTIAERVEAFNSNLPTLMNNIRNALLMWNWKGDVAWINGYPNAPAMDLTTGALLVLGVGAWLARMLRRRDVVDWLIPIMVFVMILPSAFSIAYPIENPSATRMSGTLPEVYLLAAVPLALMVRSLIRVTPRFVGALASFALVALIVINAYVANAQVYFDHYLHSYVVASLPYSDAGDALRDFAETTGSYGNAFMIAYPYWWDHRAIGLEADLVDFPGGIISLSEVPLFLSESAKRADRYQFDPTKPIMFFYSPQDLVTEAQLSTWFPEGFWEERGTYQPDDTYKVFYAPPIGTEEFQRFLEVTGVLVPDEAEPA